MTIRADAKFCNIHLNTHQTARKMLGKLSDAKPTIEHARIERTSWIFSVRNGTIMIRKVTSRSLTTWIMWDIASTTPNSVGHLFVDLKRRAARSFFVRRYEVTLGRNALSRDDVLVCDKKVIVALNARREKDV